MGLVSTDINGRCVILEYETEFQAEIASITHEFGVSGAARKLGIGRTTINYWMNGGPPSMKNIQLVRRFIDGKV